MHEGFVKLYATCAGEVGIQILRGEHAHRIVDNAQRTAHWE